MEKQEWRNSSRTTLGGRETQPQVQVVKGRTSPRKTTELGAPSRLVSRPNGRQP